MILGLDFYGVLDKHPQAFVELAQAVLGDGGEVHIITAVEPQNSLKIKARLNSTPVPYTDYEIITYENWGDVPRLKFQAISARGIQLYIDDRKGTIDYLNKRGITSLLFSK